MIDYEPRAHQQVPLLLTLGEERAALHKAVESGNTDLVYTVILHLRENMPLSDFQVNILPSINPRMVEIRFSIFFLLIPLRCP